MQNIPKNKKERMTMNKLAQMTASGFSGLRNEFKGDVNRLEEKMEKIENKTNILEYKIDKIENKTNVLEDRIEKGVNKIFIAVDGMAKQFSNWKQENAFGAGIESWQDEQLKDHEVRIKKLETV